MTLRIVRSFGAGKVILKLIGRIRSEDIGEIRIEMEGFREGLVLDLGDVSLVDLDAVRFLAQCERQGIDLVNCVPYVRDWITLEQNKEQS